MDLSNLDDEQHLRAWLRLNHEPGVGPVLMRQLLTRFGAPEAVLAATLPQLLQVAPQKVAQQLARPASDELQALIDKAITWAQQDQHTILTWADEQYPASLLEVPDPPPVLYVLGNPAALQQTMIGVVGARNATQDGLNNAQTFARTFAQSGLGVVSGLALGIDGAAHRGALAAQGGDAGTVAVIGTGADIVYPASHRDLAHQIAAHPTSCIVSEFALGTKALNYNFPRRNRIISGLARGVLVVEAAPQSGSLITARQAGEQGREVFAIPGSIHSPLARGCHALIKQGAKLVETAQDVLEELGMVMVLPTQPAAKPAKRVASTKAVRTPVPPATVQAVLPQSSTPTAIPVATGGDVLTALGYDPITVDAIVQRSGLGADQVNAQLLELELAGQVQRLAGGRIQRIS